MGGWWVGMGDARAMMDTILTDVVDVDADEGAISERDGVVKGV